MKRSSAWLVALAITFPVAFWLGTKLLLKKEQKLEIVSPSVLEGPPVPLELQSQIENNSRIFRLTGELTQKSAVKAKQIILTFGSYSAAPSTAKIQLAISETQLIGEFDTSAVCDYGAPKIQIFDNQELVLPNQSECNLASNKTYHWVLSVVVPKNSAERLAVWGVAANRGQGLLYKQGDSLFALRADFVVGDPVKVSPWTLLMHMWRHAHLGSTAIIICSGLGFFIGIWAMLTNFLTIASFLLFFSISCWYAAVFPPFHAPDEPDHLIAFRSLNGFNDGITQAEALARHGHFGDLKQIFGARFRAAFQLRPSDDAWGLSPNTTIADSQMKSRSLATSTIWQLLPKAIKHAPIEWQLLILRILGAFAVSISVACFTSCMRYSSSADPSLGTLLLIAVPSLAFFAMGVSNYPYALSLAIFLFSALLWFIQKEQYGLAIGGFLGVATTLFILTIRGGILLLPSLIILMASGIAATNKFKSKIFKCLGLFCGELLVFILNQEDGGAFSALLKDLKSFDFLIKDTSFTTEPIHVAMILCFLGIFCVYSISLLVQRFLFNEKRGWLYQLILWTPCTFLSFFFVGHKNLNIKIPDIEVNREISIFRYIRSVISTMISDLNWNGFDYFYSQTFWGGFGWLDIELSIPWLKASKTIPIFLFTFAAILTAIKKRYYLACWSLLGFFSALLYLVCLSTASYLIHQNLHGRYLLIFYTLSLLGISVFINSVLAIDQFKAEKIIPLIRGGFLTAIAIFLIVVNTRIIDRFF